MTEEMVNNGDRVEVRFSWKRLLITSIIVILTAGITFGITWFILDKSVKESDEASNHLRVVLQKEIDDQRNKLKTEGDDLLTYTNTAFGFQMTFPENWKEYKLLEKKITGATKTWYVELPTTSSNWKNSTSTSDAGYFSLFAVSAYTDAEWSEVQSQEGPKDTEIVKIDGYTLGYTRAQSAPEEMADRMSEIKGIVATIKTN